MSSGSSWRRPPETLALGHGEVHVWHASLEWPTSIHAALAASLSESERERAVRYHFERDRRHFEACRGLLRSLLGRYLACRPEEVAFELGPHGKPALRAPVQPDMSFNVSHSGGEALLAFARKAQIGVDLERVRPLDGLAMLAKRTFAEAETRELLSLGETERLRAFFTCWTRKEAFIKAVGEGLSFPLSRFEVTLRPEEPARLRHIDGDAAAASTWQLTDLPLGSDFAGALALPGRYQVQTWSWTGRA